MTVRVGRRLESRSAGVFVEEHTGIHSRLDGPTRYTVVHSRTVALLFVDTRPVDAIAFHHDLLGADDPKSFFPVPGWDLPGRKQGQATSRCRDCNLPHLAGSGHPTHFCRAGEIEALDQNREGLEVHL